ncbi:hypothetical protein [Anaeromyxobacter oryzae]|uniref:Uncharacterized protein n=1 Tax=Anaeromyxobacter oryzae TaxID=2918170 RepID=A0ABM7X212_9BACT|nr:hypothetical protein [Anaeromyxobacter oryzae]BDG05831.1 hypothetical protein AMOR_48270 [Anaeromyxobacter oryzae]
MARLAAIDGVAEARVDATGRHFLVVVAPGAGDAEVERRAIEALGGRAARLDDAAARAQLAARPRGDPWFSAAETLALCYVEARVLAARAGSAAAAAAGLGADDEARVAEVARVALFAVMERVHAEGGRPSSGWFAGAWPGIAREVAAACRTFLPPAVADAVASALARQHAAC